MATVPTPVGGDRTSRIILLISLALNLFFLGLISAGPVKHLFHPHQRVVMEPRRSAAERIDRLAGTLPTDDADKPQSLSADEVRDWYERFGVQDDPNDLGF